MREFKVVSEGMSYLKVIQIELPPKLQDMGYSDPLWKHFIKQNVKDAWNKALCLENGERDVIVCGKTKENMKYLQLMAKLVHTNSGNIFVGQGGALCASISF